MMNKKGVGLVATVLLVLMVLTTVSYALYSFTKSSGKISYTISDASLTEVLSAKEQIVKFYITEAGKNSFIKTYSDFVKNGEYIDNPEIISGKYKFKNLNSKLNEKFSVEFKNNFLEEFNKYEFDKDYLKLLKSKIQDVKMDYNNGIAVIELDSWETEDESKSVKIYYNPQIIIKLDFNDFRLDSFENLKKAKDACILVSDNIGNCYFNNLVYFNIIEKREISSGVSYIHFTSKEQFLIGESYQKIEFDFIPD